MGKCSFKTTAIGVFSLRTQSTIKRRGETCQSLDLLLAPSSCLVYHFQKTIQFLNLNDFQTSQFPFFFGGGGQGFRTTIRHADTVLTNV